MDLRLLCVTLLTLSTTLYINSETIRVCKYRYRYLNGHEYHNIAAYCNEVITCAQGTYIVIRSALNSNTRKTRNSRYCGNVCPGVLRRSQTNSISHLCNGIRICTLSRWNTDKKYWILEVNYDCLADKEQSTFPTTLKYSTLSTDSIKYSNATSTLPTKSVTTNRTSIVKTTSAKYPAVSLISTTYRIHRMTTSSKDTSRYAESKSGNHSTSVEFPITSVALSVTAGIFVLVTVLIGIVCIKRKKANKESSDKRHAQHNPLEIAIQAITNKTNEVNSAQENSIEPSEPEYEYDEEHIAKHMNNENDYNTLNETNRPLNADPNYDHIPKQPYSMTKATSKPNDDVYNTINETVQHLNDDSNYDHMHKRFAPIDETYSHVNGDGNCVVNDTDTYSHLNQ